MISEDGISWTLVSSPTLNRDWRSVTYSKTLGRFVAVASSGVGNRAMYSRNGVDWFSGQTPISSGLVEGSWVDVTYSEKMQLFVAVAGIAEDPAVSVGGTVRLMSSNDGIIWRKRHASVDSNTYNATIWNDYYNMWYSVGNSTAMSSKFGLGTNI
jgi:hypothetical protein